MQEQNGSTYKSATFAKALFAGEHKEYKTSTLMAYALGKFPWQRNGGIVSRPEDLYIIPFDMGALTGALKFLKETLGATDEEITKIKIFNMQQDVAQAFESEKAYDHTLYGSVLSVQQRLRDATAGGGTPVVLFSSLTVLAMALERAIMGPPTGSGKSGKGVGDEDRWGLLKRQLFTIQNAFQVDAWHMFWEAHVLKGTEEAKETLQISGSAGRNWGVNMEQIFRLQRGSRINLPTGKSLEQMTLNTRPSTEFIANGRGFNEALNPQEPDLTVALYKLGLKVGCYGKKTEAK